jgi:hypothetical protein
MDENECALMKFIHDDVGDGDVGHDQLVIMFEDAFMTIGPQFFCNICIKKKRCAKSIHFV